MAAEPPSGGVGWLSSFIEIYSCMYTRQAWEAFWQLLHTTTNPYAWGYDLWYAAHAKAYFNQHYYPDGSEVRVGSRTQQNLHSGQQRMPYRQGIVATVQSRHIQGHSPTDNSQGKWNGVMKQEVFFSKFKGTPLKKYRGMFTLRNLTSTGAIVGPLGAVPVKLKLPVRSSPVEREHTGGALEQDLTQGRGLVVINFVQSVDDAVEALATLESLGFRKSGEKPADHWWHCVVLVTAEQGLAETEPSRVSVST